MEFVKVEKTVYVRDQYRVKRQLFVAGQIVEKNAYEAALAGEEPVKKSSVSTQTVVENSEPVAPEVVAEPEKEVKPAVAEVTNEPAETKPAKKTKTKEGK